MDRIEAMDFLKICRQDLDRLIEQSPQIPDPIIAEFEREFKEVPNLKMPDICHGLEHTGIYNSNQARLTKMTADAALYLKHKKRLLRDDILPDLTARINTSVETIVHKQLNERIQELEARIQELTKEDTDEDAPPAPTRALEGDWRRLLTNRHIYTEDGVEVGPNVVITVTDEDAGQVTESDSLPGSST